MKMNKTIFSAIPTICLMTVCVMCCVDSFSQVPDDAFRVFRKDGTWDIFFRSEVDSIVFAEEKPELSNNLYLNYIYMGGARFRVPLNLIDSVSFSREDDVDNTMDDSNYISVPEQPRLAVINIMGIDAMPVQKDIEAHAWVEVLTGVEGIRFKKKAIVKLQGNASTVFVKKGFSVKFCEDDWKGNKTTDIVIGNWVTQDAFHFKAFYTSFTKGECPVGYKLYDKFMENKPTGRRVPFMDYGLEDEYARCYPDGFPCAVFLNSKFYGIYSWQLKKHRDNYNMNRNNTSHIHIDGTLGTDQIWKGNISWTSFEVRNPDPKPSKWTLMCQNGEPYDGDKPTELMGADSQYYNNNDLSCTNSAMVKSQIVALSKYMEEIEQFENAYNSASGNNKDEALTTLRAEIERRFSMEYLIDYVIFLNILQNWDGTAKNWQWTTWGEIDGKVRWYVNPYDLDSSFGVHSTTGFYILKPAQTTVGKSLSTPAGYVWAYYLGDMKARYRYLRDAGAISYETIWNLMKKWIDSIGTLNYEREKVRWSETPGDRNPEIDERWEWQNVSYITYSEASSNWLKGKKYSSGVACKHNNRYYVSMQDSNIGHVPGEDDGLWWQDMTVKPGKYKAGDTIYDGYCSFYLFRAKQDITVVKDDTSVARPDNFVGAPFKKFYSSFPYEGGVQDSVERVRQWIRDKIELMDKQMGYN